MDDYAELFDPRAAPAEMLPFLAGWLQVLKLARFQDDEDAFRFALSQAAELAQTRGTIDGLILAVRITWGSPSRSSRASSAAPGSCWASARR